MINPNLSAEARLKLSACARLDTDRTTGKPMILYPNGALTLSRTGFVVASLCNGEMTLRQIFSQLASRFSTGNDQIEAAVALDLSRLQSHNLIEVAVR